MAEDNNVRITGWPKEPAQLTHRFEMEEPCQVSISFQDTPAQVIFRTNPDQPLVVDMNMHCQASEPFPVCIKVCEPICAESNYTVGINIFDNPFATINVRGITRLFNCREKPEQPPEEPPEPGTRVCVNFKEMNENQEFPAPFPYQGLTFIPLKYPLRAMQLGDPLGVTKLAFPPTGMRIEFPDPVTRVTLTVNNYSGPSLNFAAFDGETLLDRFTLPINEEVKTVEFPQPRITAVEINGGGNESSLIEVCYTTL